MDKGKWFILKKLNPKPGESLGKYGLRIIKTRYGDRLQGDMRYTGHRFMYFSGEYEVNVSRIIFKILRPGWRFIDIGANIGFYSVMAANIADEVISIEPNPITRDLLIRNLKLNGRGNVRVISCGLSDMRGHGILSQVGADIGGATLRRRGDSTLGYGIEVFPGDELFSRSSNQRTLVKIDVEGWEYKVVKGLTSLFKQPDIVVIMEITDDWLRETGASGGLLLELMKSLGFQAFEIYRPPTRIKTNPRLRRINVLPDAFQSDLLFAKYESVEALWEWVGSYASASRIS